MSTILPNSRVGVCSWSLQPTDPDHLIQQVRATGLNCVQCAIDPARTAPEVWGDLPARCQAAGLAVVSGMFGTVGEDYSTLDSIRRTGGIVPDATWEENARAIQADADWAGRWGLRLVTFHAGFVPHEPGTPVYERLLDRVRQVADWFATRGIAVALETGQETAESLQAFLRDLDRPNLGINFDPANMILYDKGDPIAALRVLSPWIKQCHVKDAVRTRVPGSWGEEVAAGAGQVDWRLFFQTLEELGFRGDLMIEREAGNQRGADIRAARQLVLAQLGRREP